MLFGYPSTVDKYTGRDEKDTKLFKDPSIYADKGKDLFIKEIFNELYDSDRFVCYINKIANKKDVPEEETGFYLFYPDHEIGEEEFHFDGDVKVQYDTGIHDHAEEEYIITEQEIYHYLKEAQRLYPIVETKNFPKKNLDGDMKKIAEAVNRFKNEFNLHDE